jgi:propanediol dehydratase small subunit
MLRRMAVLAELDGRADLAARLRRSASATEVPPNFMTTVLDTADESRRRRR